MILDMNETIKLLDDYDKAGVLPKSLIMNETDLIDTMNRGGITLVKEKDLEFNKILSTLMIMRRILLNEDNIIIKSVRVLGATLYPTISAGWIYYVNYNKQMIFQYHLGRDGESFIGYPLQRADSIELYEIEY